MARILKATALLLALTATGCMRRSAVWVEDGSTRERLQIWVAATREARGPIPSLSLVRIGRCGDWPNVQMVWEAAGDLVDSGKAEAFLYGRPPAGLTSRRGPAPLEAGCYIVEVSGTGVSASTCFEVEADGRVTPLRGGTLKCEPN